MSWGRTAVVSFSLTLEISRLVDLDEFLLPYCLHATLVLVPLMLVEC
jgi:hypothetical protein